MVFINFLSSVCMGGKGEKCQKLKLMEKFCCFFSRFFAETSFFNTQFFHSTISLLSAALYIASLWDLMTRLYMQSTLNNTIIEFYYHSKLAVSLGELHNKSFFFIQLQTFAHISAHIKKLFVGKQISSKLNFFFSVFEC